MGRHCTPLVEAGIDFSDLIPSALALALEIDRIHAIADGEDPDALIDESDNGAEHAEGGEPQDHD